MRKTWMALVGVAACAAGCAGAAGTSGVGGTGQALLPASAMPKPGECRLWFPEKFDAQPPSGDCQKLQIAVPGGAWFLRRPAEEPRIVHVAVIAKNGTVARRHIVNAESGREIVPAK